MKVVLTKKTKIVKLIYILFHIFIIVFFSLQYNVMYEKMGVVYYLFAFILSLFIFVNLLMIVKLKNIAIDRNFVYLLDSSEKIDLENIVNVSGSYMFFPFFINIRYMNECEEKSIWFKPKYDSMFYFASSLYFFHNPFIDELQKHISGEKYIEED